MRLLDPSPKPLMCVTNVRCLSMFHFRAKSDTKSLIELRFTNFWQTTMNFEIKSIPITMSNLWLLKWKWKFVFVSYISIYTPSCFSCRVILKYLCLHNTDAWKLYAMQLKSIWHFTQNRMTNDNQIHGFWYYLWLCFK